MKVQTKTMLKRLKKDFLAEKLFFFTKMFAVLENCSIFAANLRKLR